MALTKIERRERIKMRIRKIVSGTAEHPRMTVFRSNKQIYVQFIDDLAGVTLATRVTRVMTTELSARRMVLKPHSLRKDELERMKLRTLLNENLHAFELQQWKALLELRRSIMVCERLLQG